MKDKNYFKSTSELTPGEIYYTQLEQWSFNDDGTTYWYLGKYISSKTIQELQKNNQEDIANILLTTHNIPITYSENKSLSLDELSIKIVSKYIFSVQEQIMENFDIRSHSSKHYKHQIESKINKLAHEYITIIGNNEQQKQAFSRFLEILYQLINDNSLIDKINNHNGEDEHPIRLNINNIIEECKIFFCTNLSSTQVSDLYIKTNIPNLIQNIENYLYVLHYPQQEPVPQNENTEYNDTLISLQEIIKLIDNHTFEKTGDNQQNPISIKLFHNLVRYIGQIKIRPNTSQEQEKIWYDIQDIYINFIKTAHDTEDEEIIRQGILHLKKQLGDCDIIINQLINIKKYKYENVIPTSPLGLFLTLKDKVDKSGTNKLDKDEIRPIVQELQKFTHEDFRNFDQQELETLQEIIKDNELYELFLIIPGI